MINENKIVAYLLSEDVSTPANIKILSDKNSCAKIEADLQDGSEWNRNTRKYPISVIRNGLERENIRELIARRSWFGEAGHPINPTPQRQTTVVQNNVSHRILSYDIRGPIVHGIIKTAPTKQGKFMRDVILDKEDPMESAFSLRAMGPTRVTPQGKIVQDPLVITTYDWVFYPSHRNAYQTKVLAEASNIIGAENDMLMESAICIPMYEQQAIDYVKEESKNYKLVSNFLESYGLDARLSDNNKMIYISEATATGKNTMCIGVEDYISREINDFYKSFR